MLNTAASNKGNCSRPHQAPQNHTPLRMSSERASRSTTTTTTTTPSSSPSHLLDSPWEATKPIFRACMACFADAEKESPCPSSSSSLQHDTSRAEREENIKRAIIYCKNSMAQSK
ncbi:hypothetical protein Dimus_034508 [Dionaea muscipula]